MVAQEEMMIPVQLHATMFQNSTCTNSWTYNLFHSLQEVHWRTGFCVQASQMLEYKNPTQLQPSKTWPWILSGEQTFKDKM